MSRFQRGFAIIAALSAVLVGLACSLGNFTLNLGGEEGGIILSRFWAARRPKTA